MTLTLRSIHPDRSKRLWLARIKEFAFLQQHQSDIDSSMSDSHALPPSLAGLLADLPLAQLAFTPVPGKARRDGWTPERQIGFIHRLALCGCVGTAASAVGMSRESAYRLRERDRDGSFARAWDVAFGWGERRSADLALERAICGERRPIMYRGRQVGERVVHDNRLAIALLERSARRERHRDYGPGSSVGDLATIQAFLNGRSIEKQPFFRAAPGDLCDL